MKEFVFKVDARGAKDALTPNRPPRKWLVWAGLFVMCVACVMQIIQSNFLFVPLSLLYIFQLVGYLNPQTPGKLNAASMYRDQVLVFGERNLLCKQGEAIVWHIPYNRIGHLETLIAGSKWLQTSTTLVHTNDNDSYMINGEPQGATIEEIQRELESFKSLR